MLLFQISIQIQYIFGRKPGLFCASPGCLHSRCQQESLKPTPSQTLQVSAGVFEAHSQSNPAGVSRSLWSPLPVKPCRCQQESLKPTPSQTLLWMVVISLTGFPFIHWCCFTSFSLLPAHCWPLGVFRTLIPCIVAMIQHQCCMCNVFFLSEYNGHGEYKFRINKKYGMWYSKKLCFEHFLIFGLHVHLIGNKSMK